MQTAQWASDWWVGTHSHGYAGWIMESRAGVTSLLRGIFNLIFNNKSLDKPIIPDNDYKTNLIAFLI